MVKDECLKLFHKYKYKILAVCFWLFIWEVVSRIINQETLFAAPEAVFPAIINLIRSISFWETIVFSSERIILGFMLAVITGIIFAVLSYQSRLINELISPLLKVIKATPVACFIILVLIWVSAVNLSIIATFLMVVPVIFSNVYQGLKNTDEKLIEMAKVFRLSRWKQVKAIYIPAVLPFLVSSINVGLGLGLKAGIAAEVIGIPAKSIGERLYEAKLYFMTEDIFAWTIIIIIISILLEKAAMLLVRLLQKNKYFKQNGINKNNN